MYINQNIIISKIIEIFFLQESYFFKDKNSRSNIKILISHIPLNSRGYAFVQDPQENTVNFKLNQKFIHNAFNDRIPKLGRKYDRSELVIENQPVHFLKNLLICLFHPTQKPSAVQNQRHPQTERTSGRQNPQRWSASRHTSCST